ncbi:MAG: hypothetical protein OXC18_02685 [Desulfurellaceae bacterium]|nr:hypothetical protein [Desulfurellaceae bacterium]
MPDHHPLSFPLVVHDADELLQACCVHLEQQATEKATFGVEAAVTISLRHYQRWQQERAVQESADE